jgi:hypothetical protein
MVSRRSPYLRARGESSRNPDTLETGTRWRDIAADWPSGPQRKAVGGKVRKTSPNGALATQSRANIATSPAHSPRRKMLHVEQSVLNTDTRKAPELEAKLPTLLQKRNKTASMQLQTEDPPGKGDPPSLNGSIRWINSMSLCACRSSRPFQGLCSTHWLVRFIGKFDS